MRNLIIAGVLITIGILLFAMNWEHATAIPSPATPAAQYPSHTNAPESSTNPAAL